MAALNGETYTLQPSNLVIADDSGPIALAGVIGGADSAISGNDAHCARERVFSSGERAQDFLRVEASDRCVDAV